MCVQSMYCTHIVGTTGGHKFMSRKNTRIFIRAEDELRRRLEMAADLAFEGNISLLAREALNEKLERMAEKFPQHKEELAPAV